MLSPKKQEWADTISKILGVDYVVLNSSKTSAANRVRYYWANFDISEPEDKNITLESVLEFKDVVHRASIIGRRLNENGVRSDNNKELPITQCL